MRPVTLLTAGILMLSLIGCTADPPASVEREERAISSVVALLVGYESDGLASLLADLVEDSLIVQRETPLVIHASRSASEPARLFVRSRRGVSAIGESRTRCEVRATPAIEPGSGEGVSVELDGSSLHASNAISIRALNYGTITLAADGPLLERYASGELRVDGSLGDRPGDGVPFTQLEATLTWSHLKLVDVPPASAPAMVGSIAISISAGGPGGMIIRNGVLTLDGTEHAILVMGGRQIAIDVRRARVTKE
jgi:hypothetical protein